MPAATLAELAGISPQYLSDIERGHRDAPSEQIVVSLCEWLHVSVAVGQFYAGYPAVELDHVKATDAQIDAALSNLRVALLFPQALAAPSLANWWMPQ